MKKINKFLVLCFVMVSSFGQTTDIEIIQKNTTELVIVSIKNNTSERKEVSLIVVGYDNIKDPITKLVNKGEVTEFTRLLPSSKKSAKASLAYTYVSKPTDEEIDIKQKKLEQKKGNLNADFSKGVFVFTSLGCGRCERTLNYLLDNNLNFQNFDTTENPEFLNLMWKKLKEKRSPDKIKMPVIIVDGRLTYSHKDLDIFLKKIKS